MDKLQSLVAMQYRQASIEIKACNAYTSRYGVVLSDEDAFALAAHRMQMLTAYGRIEWDGGILPKLIYAFCDSPYVFQENYVETLVALQEMFYYFKNESLDEMGDDDLIAVMKEYFDGHAQGSIEYLQETALEEICRTVRYGEDR